MAEQFKNLASTTLSADIDDAATSISVASAMGFTGGDFRILVDTVLPEIRSRRRVVRIWSAGCSTGEEPYSLRIAADEATGPGMPRAEIVGTDISAPVIAAARAPGSRGGTSTPVLPSSTTSETPPTSVAATAQPEESPSIRLTVWKGIMRWSARPNTRRISSSEGLITSFCSVGNTRSLIETKYGCVRSRLLAMSSTSFSFHLKWTR